jgi:hypothetical protein
MVELPDAQQILVTCRAAPGWASELRGGSWADFEE